MSGVSMAVGTQYVLNKHTKMMMILTATVKGGMTTLLSQFHQEA